MLLRNGMKSQNREREKRKTKKIKLDTLSVDPYFLDNKDTLSFQECIHQITLLPREIPKIISDYGYIRQFDVRVRPSLIAELQADVDYTLHVDGMIYTVKCLTPKSIIHRRNYKWEVLETFHISGEILGIDFIELSPSVFRFVIAIRDIIVPFNEIEKETNEVKDMAFYVDSIILTDTRFSTLKMCCFGQNKIPDRSNVSRSNFRRMIIDRERKRIMLFCNDCVYAEYNLDLERQSPDGIEKDLDECRRTERYTICNEYFVVLEGYFFMLSDSRYFHPVAAHRLGLRARNGKRMQTKFEFAIVDHEPTTGLFKLFCMLGAEGIVRIKTFDRKTSRFILPDLEFTFPDKFEPFSMNYYNGVIELCGTIASTRNVVLLYR
jgi:hypothetical protein